MKITIGIDLSIHSTGICIIQEEKEGKSIPSFFLILSDQKYSKTSIDAYHKNSIKEVGKKNKNNNTIKVLFYEYSKCNNGNGKQKQKEISKSLNVSNILDIIDQNIFRPIFNKNKNNIINVNIESIALSASGTIDQLSGLNYGIRYLLLKKYGLLPETLGLITPTTLKKNSVGSGKAEKDIMVSSFKTLLSKDQKNKNNKKLLENIEYFENNLKWSIDDLADAYFLAVDNF